MKILKVKNVTKNQYLNFLSCEVDEELGIFFGKAKIITDKNVDVDIKDKFEIYLDDGVTEQLYFTGYARDGGKYRSDGLVEINIDGIPHEVLNEKISLEFTDKTPEYIISQIFSGTGYGISTGITGVTLQKYTINDKRKRAIKDMMDVSGYTIRMQQNTTTIHFKQVNEGSSGITIDTSTTACIFYEWVKDDIKTIVNKIKIIGRNKDDEKYTGEASDSSSIATYGEFFELHRIDFLKDDTEAYNVAQKLLSPTPKTHGRIGIAFSDINYECLLNKTIHITDNVRNIDGDYLVVAQKVLSNGMAILTVGETDRIAYLNEQKKELDVIEERADIVYYESIDENQNIPVQGNTDGDTTGVANQSNTTGNSISGGIGDDNQGTIVGQAEDIYTSQNISDDNWHDLATPSPLPTSFGLLQIVVNIMVKPLSATSTDLIYVRLYNQTDDVYYPNSNGMVCGLYTADLDALCLSLSFLISNNMGWEGDTIKIQVKMEDLNTDAFKVAMLSYHYNKVPTHTHQHSLGIQDSGHTHPITENPHDHPVDITSTTTINKDRVHISKENR